jgi:hypothetical protein
LARAVRLTREECEKILAEVAKVKTLPVALWDTEEVTVYWVGETIVAIVYSPSPEGIPVLSSFT